MSATPSKYARRGAASAFMLRSTSTILFTDEHLDNLFPCGESVNQNVGRLELVGSSVLLDLWAVSATGDTVIL